MMSVLNWAETEEEVARVQVKSEAADVAGLGEIARGADRKSVV